MVRKRTIVKGVTVAVLMLLLFALWAKYSWYARQIVPGWLAPEAYMQVVPGSPGESSRMRNIMPSQT